MPYYLLLAFGGLWAVLFLRFNRAWLYKVALNSVAVLDTMLSDKSDDEKLEILPKATASLLGSLLLSLLLIVLAIGIAYLPYGGSEYLFGPSPERPAWLEITALSIGASIPFFLPFRRGLSNYSELSILLHRLVLNHPAIGMRLFKRELKQKKKAGIGARKDFVIISGLARAGTTSLMNLLAARDEFDSLSYANMPFLLSPNLWAKIYNPKKGTEKERSHKDGIKIGLKSYEALEEYYHKVAADNRFIKDNRLVEYDLSQEEVESYLDYQSLIRKSARHLYLAKNNNFLLRYKSIRKYNSDFVMVLLFREPLSHASSLMEKHRQYSEMQAQDPFILEYMNWLGHHEFGEGHKAFQFEGQALVEGKPQDLNYWLELWLNYYQRALAIDDSKTLFLAYEDFCAQPNEALHRIFKAVNLSPEKTAIPAFKNSREIEAKADPALVEKAGALYQKLKAKA